MSDRPEAQRHSEQGIVSAAGQAPTPFFVIGAGRSGSTLLRLMLASHSHICIPPETWYLIPLLKRFTTEEVLTPTALDSAISIMTSHYRWPDMRLGTAKFRELIAEIDKPRLRDLVECVYLWHMARDRKSRWGDKTPAYVAIVPQLERLFPGARFIHLLRDGRDVAASFQRQGWYGPWLYSNAREWSDALECDSRWKGQPIEAQVLRVHYEDLVLNTERTLRTVCQFIEEEFEPQMLAWEGRVDESVPLREQHIHQKLKSRPSAEDVYRWKREMPLRQIWIAESFMRVQLDQAGYERRFSSVFWTPAMLVTQIICKSVFPVVEFQMRAFGYLRRRLRALVRPKP